jgi:site-specific DNA-adenine methylase
MPKIPYPGGKARLAKQIISFLPKQGGTYLEPFAGRGNLFWSAVEMGLQYERWWLNDIATAPFFDAIRTHGHSIKVPPRSRQEFERQRDAFSDVARPSIRFEVPSDVARRYRRLPRRLGQLQS